jgi:hypothetical protein
MQRGYVSPALSRLLVLPVDEGLAVMEVTACIVTRGNVDLTEILDSIPKGWDRVVYDNSMEQHDAKVFGRYEAIDRAMTEVVYVQDDDCVLPPESFTELARAYEPGVLTANMPEAFRAHYTDSCLIGFGAIFDRLLPHRAWSPLDDYPPNFERVCDVYFTTLAKQKWVDLPYRNLPWAWGKDRMFRQAEHVGERMAALAHARSLR